MRTGLIGKLLSIGKTNGFGLIDLPDLDAIGIADITLLEAAGLSPRAPATTAPSVTSNSPHPHPHPLPDG